VKRQRGKLRKKITLRQSIIQRALGKSKLATTSLAGRKASLYQRDDERITTRDIHLQNPRIITTADHTLPLSSGSVWLEYCDAYASVVR
jgi:hypothetical protein